MRGVRLHGESRESPCQEFLSSYLPGHAVETALDDETRKEIYLIPGNDKCADCGASNPQKSVSVSLGILVCIQCSGLIGVLWVYTFKSSLFTPRFLGA